MRNFRFLLVFDGTKYLGWEHQPGTDMTIQGKLERVLQRMTGKEVEVIGCGRTDAGVHAKGYVANAHLETTMSAEEVRSYMNRYLPEDIGVKEVKVVSDRFHARYNAMGKTYCYTFYVGDMKPIFNRKYACTLEQMPDVEAMKQAAAFLVGEHDFKSFCGNPKMKKSTVRVVDRIDIDLSGGYLNITYHGKGFLQYMCRILTGTLLEVGLHQRSAESMTQLLEARDRRLAGITAEPQGLCLLKVDYARAIDIE